MTLDEILTLVKAGYSKDEITALTAGTPAAAEVPATTAASDPVAEVEAPKNIVTPDATKAPENSQLTEQANALLNILQGVPIPPKVSIDDKLTALLNGLIVGDNQKGE